VASSLRRVLEGTFPATRRLLGPQRFAEIALAFIRSAPPDRPQLLAYGFGFPGFVARSGEAPTLAYAADVARLEWVREEAYYAPDAPPLSAADLAAIPVARYAGLRIELHPSLRLIRSTGPVFALWQAAIDASTEAITAASQKAGPEQVLVVRPAMTVTTRPVAAADLLLLEALGEGMPLAEAAKRAEAESAGFDLQAALALHLAGGSFAGCR
jgi:Putative DNA-binding domain